MPSTKDDDETKKGKKLRPSTVQSTLGKRGEKFFQENAEEHRSQFHAISSNLSSNILRTSKAYRAYVGVSNCNPTKNGWFADVKLFVCKVWVCVWVCVCRSFCTILLMHDILHSFLFLVAPIRTGNKIKFE